MKRIHRCALAIALAIMVAALPAWAQQYNEAPMLAEMVAAGDLPPVEERLPAKPFVRQVHSEIGTYGGTLNKWDTNLRNAFFTLYGYVFNTEMGGYGFDTPFDINAYLENGMFFTGHEPYHFERYEYNDDYTEVTCWLREGLKWSDGHPFTVDDIVWSWNEIAIHPNVWNPPGHWATLHGGSNMTAEKVGDNAVKYTSNSPNPRMHTLVTIYEMVHAKHYFEQFHPDHNADATWEDLIDRLLLGGSSGGTHTTGFIKYPDELPQLGAWVYTSTDEVDGVLATRNPYYPVVDPAGNQLPYIDHIRIRLFSSVEAGVLSTFRGEVDVQSTHYTDLSGYQVLKENEERGDYKVSIWKGGASQGYYLLNIEPEGNPQLAKYVREVDFRRAMSLAINREEVNDTLYFGLAEASGTTLSSESFFHDPAMEMWGGYEPDRARELLAGLGLKDSDGDGFVEYPEGGKVTIILNNASNLRPNLPLGEMAVKYWQDIGLDVRMEVVQASVIFENRTSGEVQMYSNWGPSMQVFLPYVFLGNAFNPETHMGSRLDDPPPEYLKAWEMEQEFLGQQDPESYTQKLKEFLTYVATEVTPEIAVTSGFPVPFVVHNRMGNVPSTGVNLKGESSAHPEQFYIKS